MGNKLSCCLSQIKEIKRTGKNTDESILNVIEELKKIREGNYTFNSNRIYLDNKEKYWYLLNKINDDLYECITHYVDYDNY
jgi:hypothetical protein